MQMPSDSNKKLKCDFHIHTKDDPIDCVKHSVFDLLDLAAEKGYDAIAVTNHGALSFSQGAADYASEKGIVLVPGIEIYIKRKHIVILNADKDAEKIRTFMDLKDYKRQRPEIFVYAPHPYYPAKSCLHELLESNIDLFDGIEYCHFYLRFFDLFNRKALKMAGKYSKTVIACSDTHSLVQFGSAYTILDAEKNISSIIEGLKSARTDIFTKPVTILRCLKIFWKASHKKRKLVTDEK